ncbi:hypothetical protein ccbrp13_33440 [Ktedonobacteria bacterium brp13]|nr:hypothetical protein ccbrp13_33440 [Ktedonobacteria bacterium brp13]
MNFLPPLLKQRTWHGIASGIFVQALRTRGWWMSGLLCLGGLLLGLWMLSHTSVLHGSNSVMGREGRGRAGVMEMTEMTTPLLDQKICGHPAVVFQQLGFSSKDVPAKAILAQLPTSQQHAVKQTGDMSYDPKTDTFCTIGWQGIATRYVPSPSIDPGSVDPGSGTNGGGNGPGSISMSWVQGILNGLFSSFASSLAGFLNGLLSWAKTFGFMFITPDGLTYAQPVVANLNARMVGVMDSLLVLALIIGGYKVVLGQHDLLREFAPGFLFAGVVGTFSLFFITQAIELQNALCLSFLGALASAGIGNLSLPLGVINWATALFYEIITYLIDLLISVLLSLQMLVRLSETARTPARYQIPTHLNVPDRIAIPLLGITFHVTIRQGLIFFVGWSTAFHLWGQATGLSAYGTPGQVMRILVPVCLAMATLVVATLRITDRYVETWAVLILRYRQAPRICVWQPLDTDTEATTLSISSKQQREQQYEEEEGTLWL